HFIRERLRARRRRIGVGHFEDRRHAPKDRGARAGLEILLVSEAGLAKMNLRVDHARQDVKSHGIDRLTRARTGKIANRGNLSVQNADIARADPSVVGNGPALQEQVEVLRHFTRSFEESSLRLSRARLFTAKWGEKSRDGWTQRYAFLPIAASLR